MEGHRARWNFSATRLSSVVLLLHRRCESLYLKCVVSRCSVVLPLHLEQGPRRYPRTRPRPRALPLSPLSTSQCLSSLHIATLRFSFTFPAVTIYAGECSISSTVSVNSSVRYVCLHLGNNKTVHESHLVLFLYLSASFRHISLSLSLSFVFRSWESIVCILKLGESIKVNKFTRCWSMKLHKYSNSEFIRFSVIFSFQDAQSDSCLNSSFPRNSFHKSSKWLGCRIPFAKISSVKLLIERLLHFSKQLKKFVADTVRLILFFHVYILSFGD